MKLTVRDVTVEFYNRAPVTIPNATSVRTDYARNELVITTIDGGQRRYKDSNVSGLSASVERRAVVPQR